MHFLEQEAVAGLGSQTVTNRWGDYAQMTIDPSDDATFWHTGPYMYLGGAVRTRIFSLTFSESFLSIADAYMSKTLVVGYLGNNKFNLTSNSNGQKTVGFCSFVAYFSQLLFAS